MAAPCLGTGGLCSRTARRHTARNTITYECHLHETGHVATQQPGLKPGGLCHLGCPAGALVPW